MVWLSVFGVGFAVGTTGFVRNIFTRTSLQCQVSQAGGDDHDGQPGPSFEKQLENALKTGAFDIRGHLGQKFQAAHKKGGDQHSMYNQSQGHKQKPEFRAKWAKDYFLMLPILIRTLIRNYC